MLLSEIKLPPHILWRAPDRIQEQDKKIFVLGAGLGNHFVRLSQSLANLLNLFFTQLFVWGRVTRNDPFSLTDYRFFTFTVGKG